MIFVLHYVLWLTVTCVHFDCHQLTIEGRIYFQLTKEFQLVGSSGAAYSMVVELKRTASKYRIKMSVIQHSSMSFDNNFHCKMMN